MEYRQLGRSGLRMSTLSLGTMTFGGVGVFAKAGNTETSGAKRLIDQALEAGINVVDTANMYSDGRSEEIVGEIMGSRWGDTLLVTKARMRIGPGPNDGGSGRYHLIREVERSLKRLKRDHIDLFYLHEWDGETPLEETLQALDDLVRSGKIRYTGVSNFSAWHLMKGLGIADKQGLPRFVSQQIHYSLEAREAEYELIPASVDQGLGLLIWSPIAGGLLSGKYRRNQAPPAGSRHLKEWNEPPIRDENRLYRIVDALVKIGEAHGVSAAQVALAWLLGRPAVTSLVIGATNEKQLADNIASASLKLTAQERQRLDKVSAIPLLYPYWHQAKTANDRLSPADLTLLGPHIPG